MLQSAAKLIGTPTWGCAPVERRFVTAGDVWRRGLVDAIARGANGRNGWVDLESGLGAERLAAPGAAIHGVAAWARRQRREREDK
ncbi:MAG: hypothetical protein ACQESR_01235 [Planctomycetota bacterium]